MHFRNLPFEDIIRVHLGQRIKQKDNEYQQVCAEHYSKVFPTADLANCLPSKMVILK